MEYRDIGVVITSLLIFFSFIGMTIQILKAIPSLRNPKEGEVWILKSKNPFKDPPRVRIDKVKNGWVRYRFIVPNTQPEPFPYEEPVSNFKALHEFLCDNFFIGLEDMAVVEAMQAVQQEAVGLFRTRPMPVAIESDGSKWISADELMFNLRGVHSEMCGGDDDAACGCPLFLLLLDLERSLLALE